MDQTLLIEIQRIAAALERLSPITEASTDLNSADAFVWDAERSKLKPVAKVNHIPLALLQGINDTRDALLANTTRFARGLPANNTLLWGSRGMGKSSLVKAVHAYINAETPHALVLVELQREDIASLPHLLDIVAASTRRFIIFCDDLSFETEDNAYKSLKAVLEGGIIGRPDNVLFYATSNRRHLMPREMMENERGTAINPDEVVHEKISLSDRFGLWLGFHNCSQDTYLAMIDAYAKRFKVKLSKAELHQQALEWAVTRGSRSGRVAWQFMQDIAEDVGV